MRNIVRQRILAKFDNKCCHCLSTENLQIDHIVPLSRGGQHSEFNFQVLCRTCNLKKGQILNLDQYFKIGINPKYILINVSVLEVKKSLTSLEWTSLIEYMLLKNDEFWMD